MQRILRSLAGAALLSGGVLWAHPGHGTTAPETVEHYAFEPIHAAPWIVLVAAIGVLAYRAWRQRSR